MKKLALALSLIVMTATTTVSFAQEKACCKKSAACAKGAKCCKDSKNCTKTCEKNAKAAPAKKASYLKPTTT